MKQILILLFLCGVYNNLFGQTEAITRREDRYLRENGIVNLLNSYEISLNVITAGEAFPNEISSHIEKIVSGSKNEKIFFNDLVRIENDLTPGAEALSTKEDKLVKEYLNDLVSLYKNPEANSIVFDKHYKISALKKKEYFYYNAVFTCNFKGVNIAKKSYNPVGRIAEIRIVYEEGKWYPFINGIRFFNDAGYNPASDTANLYSDFPPNVGDDDSYIDYLSKLNAEKSKHWEERDRQVRTLLEEGKRRMEEGDLRKADSLFSVAWSTNPSDRMVITARQNLKSEKEKRIKEERERQEKAALIQELKEKADNAYNSFDFESARKHIDTLYYTYSIKNDAALEKMKNELVSIHTSLDPITNAISVGRYKDAIKYCDVIIRKQEKNPLTIESYYQKAIALMKADSVDNLSKMYENLNNAVEQSKKKHSKALHLRASLKRNQKKYDEALSDASFLVNMQNNNPDYYVLRSTIYEAENRKKDAIGEYAMAVKSGSRDAAVFASKERLELEEGQYNDVISTANDGITKSGGNADVYYYRALAYQKSGNFSAAGKDFRMAKSLKLDSIKAAAFKKIAENYFESGKQFALKGNLKNAVDDFSNSLLLDTTANALYWLGRAFENDNRLQNAEETLTQLIEAYPDFKGVYYERGVVRRGNKNLEGAVGDFDAEYVRGKTKTSLLEKINTELMMEKYVEAAKDAENACRAFNDSTAFRYAAEANYRLKNYEKVISIYTLADGARALTAGTVYYCARSWYDKGDLKKAKAYFEKALEMDRSNADVAYWSGLILFQNERYYDVLMLMKSAVSSADFGMDAYYLSAVSRLKQRDNTTYKAVIGDLGKIKDTKKYNNAEVYSWIAYCQLYLNNENEFLKNLKAAGQMDSTNVIYNFVSACYAARQHNPSLAMDFLEKTSTKESVLTKNDIEKEIYLEAVRDDKDAKIRYKKLIKNRY